MEKLLFNGDSKIELQKVQDNSVDFMATDPPYGYKFMGLDFDKALPDTEIWKESFRVLKEGSFICVMAAPRTDVLWRICRDLEEAGFDMSFTNIEWVYHTGFPKASDTSKQIDKRLGVDREVIGEKPYRSKKINEQKIQGGDYSKKNTIQLNETKSNTDIGKKYEGSKLGFQPKPAREIIIVGMKPFKEKSYIDKVLNFEELTENIQRTYPLIQTPKPSKKEKDMGLNGEEKKVKEHLSKYTTTTNGTTDIEYERNTTRKNTHPTIKPIKLMSYLITLFTREGDYVLDPFMGSGTTGLACKLLNRNFIGIDFTEEYYNIAQERLEVSRDELIKTLKINIQHELF
jgi:site-specific DNA-methyltransferase (adenine-specific)